LLEDDSLLREAREVAALFTPECIEADSAHGVIGGAAGGILGLLALHRAQPSPVVLQQAVNCGQHLLAHRTASSAGLRAWSDDQGRLLTGFSHGAAGIVFALLRLYGMTDYTPFLDAAREAMAYEDSLYDSQAGNWPDLRSEQPDRSSFVCSWCHGAPGIALARLGGLLLLDTPAIRHDIDAAVGATLAYGLDGVDHVCCGAFGRIEILSEASRLLDRRDLQEQAATLAAAVLDRVSATGTFNLSTTMPGNIFQPGFFQGVSGIGYALLRLADPGALPSILLWE
jgi:lantibiotic modifying enzyme